MRVDRQHASRKSKTFGGSLNRTAGNERAEESLAREPAQAGDGLHENEKDGPLPWLARGEIEQARASRIDAELAGAAVEQIHVEENGFTDDAT
jgi:hypothetical protein